MSDLSKQVREVREKLELEKPIVESALRSSKATTDALIRGLQQEHKKEEVKFSRFTALNDRYLSVERYCSDAKRLIEFHDPTQDAEENRKRNAFAIDAHILRAYAEPWDEGKHLGFEFFSNERLVKATGNGPRVPAFVYGSFFNIRNRSSILEAGRSDISDMVAHFESNWVDTSRSSYASAQFLKDLEIAYAAEDRRKGSRNALARAFDKLMLFGGGMHLRQGFSLARLTQLLRACRFSSPEHAIRGALRDQGYSDDRIKAYSDLVRHLVNDPTQLKQARDILTDAYKRWRDINLHDAIKNLLPNPKTLRRGEINDLNAILEIHLHNTCLDHLGLDVRLNYVTLSNRLFNFLRHFDKKLLRVPLLHPRTAIMFDNSSMFEECSPAINQVLTNAVAYGTSIPSDRKITVGELDEFERTLSEPLTKIRNTFLHTAADSPEDRTRMINTARMMFSGSDELDQETQRVERALAAVEKTLESQVVQVAKIYNEDSGNLAQSAWNAYVKYAVGNENKKGVDIVWRQFRCGETLRTTCLPVGGSYRYLFALHNSSIQDALRSRAKKIASHAESDDVFSVLDIDDFLDLVGEVKDEEVDTPSELLKRKNRAFKLFMRAIFAASYKQWPLAHSLATQAHRSFVEAYIEVEENSPLRDLQARAAQVDQEILFLRHLCRRAMAEASEAGRPRLRWLKEAADDLHKSARYTLDVPREYSDHTTELSPMSLRQALASIGLQIEFAIVAKEVDDVGHFNKLPHSQSPTIAWGKLPAFKPDSIVSISDLYEACCKLEERVRSEFSAMKDRAEESSHSAQFWRYFLLRCFSMRFLLDACFDIGVFPEVPEFDAENNKESLHEVVIHHRIYRRWVASMSLAAHSKSFDGEMFKGGELLIDPDNARDMEYRDIKIDTNPFFRALLSASSIKANATFSEDEEQWAIKSPPELLGAFARMDANCNELDMFGFPRSVIRMVKKKYAPAVTFQLSQEYGEDLR